MKKEHLQSGRKNQKQETRKKILLAAQQLLEKGQEPTMEDIAAQANISRATVYRYYTNIDELSMELLLQLNVPEPFELIEQYKGSTIQHSLMGFQQTFLRFILNHENTSRKFLATVLFSGNSKLQRGQNRISVVRHYLNAFGLKLDPKTRKNLMNITVVLMGIEAVIATKDVCKLSNEESIETLQWGLEMLLKGCLNETT